MPIDLAFCLGFSISTMAGAVIVPGMLCFNKLGYGRAKRIPGTMITASTFDNINCIILFGIV